jgi:hypothetical protein
VVAFVIGETLSDLAATGQLEGRRVALLEDVGCFVPKGTVGTVGWVSTCERKATVHYVIPGRCGPFATMTVESPFCKLELADTPKETIP